MTAPQRANATHQAAARTAPTTGTSTAPGGSMEHGCWVPALPIEAFEKRRQKY